MSYMDYHNICTQCGKFSYLGKPCGCGTSVSFDESMENAFEQVERSREIADAYDRIMKRNDEETSIDELEERVEPKEDPCPGKSQSKCDHCGQCHSIFEVCVANPMHSVMVYDTSGTITASTLPKGNTDLEDLFDELGKVKWLGSDAGWDNAIEAVRENIREKLGR